MKYLLPIIEKQSWKERGVKNLARTKKYLESYSYSSYSDYQGLERHERAILNTIALPRYFSKHRDFEDFLDDVLDSKI